MRTGLFRRHFLTGRDLTLAHGRSATGADVVVDILIRQDQQQPLAHWHGGFTFLAVKTGRGKIFKLLLAHARRSLHSCFPIYGVTLSRAAELRQYK